MQESGWKSKASGASRQGWAGVRFLLRMSSIAKSKHANQGPARVPMNSRETPGKGADAGRAGSMPRPAWEAAAGRRGQFPRAPTVATVPSHVADRDAAAAIARPV